MFYKKQATLSTVCMETINFTSLRLNVCRKIGYHMNYFQVIVKFLSKFGFSTQKWKHKGHIKVNKFFVRDIELYLRSTGPSIQTPSQEQHIHLSTDIYLCPFYLYFPTLLPYLYTCRSVRSTVCLPTDLTAEFASCP